MAAAQKIAVTGRGHSAEDTPGPILIINPGSASRKYALADGPRIVLRGHFERTPEGAEVTFFDADGGEEKRSLGSASSAHTTDHFVEEAVARGLITQARPIAAVGLRIVAPGRYFQEHKLIDADYAERLEAAMKEAPLHIKPELTELAHLREIISRVPVYGISDSAFHAGLPEVARRYAIDARDAERFGIQRFGFHGISLASIVTKLPSVLGTVPPRVVICHLGSGASVTAVRDGKSLDTSMGYSPLEGLVMATRGGDIDPGALIHLAKSKGLSYSRLETYLNTQSGLLGLTGGRTGDMREVMEAAETDETWGREALESFLYRLVKYIGAYTVVLGGLDALVFTATIAERSNTIRARVCENLSGLGVELDAAANERLSGQDGVITMPSSRVTAAVVATDELAEIARQTTHLMK